MLVSNTSLKHFQIRIILLYKTSNDKHDMHHQVSVIIVING